MDLLLCHNSSLNKHLTLMLRKDNIVPNVVGRQVDAISSARYFFSLLRMLPLLNQQTRNLMRRMDPL